RPPPSSPLFPYTTLFRSPRSDRGAPDRRDDPIAVAVLFHMGEAREGIVEALDAHLVRHQHVVDAAARRLRLRSILIDRRVPAGRSEEHTSELQSRGHLVC